MQLEDELKIGREMEENETLKGKEHKSKRKSSKKNKKKAKSSEKNKDILKSASPTNSSYFSSLISDYGAQNITSSDGKMAVFTQTTLYIL